MTDKFEIGRYELTCSASRPDLLMTGETNASLNADGKHPASSNQLNSLVRNGEMAVATCLSSGADNGSAAEHMLGSFMIPATTPLTGIMENDDRATPYLAAVNVGSGAPAEPDLIAATLSTKKILNSLTVIAELAGSRPRPSSVSTDRQTRRGDDQSVSIVSRQNALHFAFRSSQYQSMCNVVHNYVSYCFMNCTFFVWCCSRLAKEKVSYEQEADKQQQKIDDLKAAGEDEYVIRKQVSNK